MNVGSLQEQYKNLLLPSEASATEKRRRGSAFEKFLESLLKTEELAPRIRLRPTGEEIDGSFHFDLHTYLLEAKWHAEPLPASSIYAFKGKVDGKLAGTIGIFISMSGYSEDAVDALTTGKNLNVVLLDRNDIEAALNHGFGRVLHAKLRAAAEEGVVFYPFTSTLATVTGETVTQNPDSPTDASELAKSENQLVILCEGYADTRILNRLGQRILERCSLSASLRVVAAQGKLGIPRVANAIHPLLPKATPLIIVADGDRNLEETEWSIRDQVNVPFDLVVIDPEIEAWFEPGAQTPKEDLKHKAKARNLPLDQYISERMESADLSEMVAKAPGFRAFFDSIVRAADPSRQHGRT